MLARIRAALAGLPYREQKMFGGVCFLVDGNMVVGTSKHGLLVRVGKDGNAAALARPHARPMEMNGRTMDGYVFVSAEGTANARSLKAWIDTALAHVATLPPKGDRPAAKARSRRVAK